MLLIAAANVAVGAGLYAWVVDVDDAFVGLIPVVFFGIALWLVILAAVRLADNHGKPEHVTKGDWGRFLVLYVTGFGIAALLGEAKFGMLVALVTAIVLNAPAKWLFDRLKKPSV